MALTGFQQTLCRLIAANRLGQGEACVAGGVVFHSGSIRGAYPDIVPQ